MGACDLDDVEEETNWLALLLKVHSNRNKRVVVRRRPCICGEVESTIMFLWCVFDQASVV